ncbi:IS2 repressor TnpA [Klebsiella pneumoniae]|nr:IS2 repressor TnpA [Klebsiella pneumoniae]
MSNTNANFEMTGILLGQEARKRKTPQEKIAIIQQTMEVEILKEAVEYGQSRKWIAHAPLLPKDGE